MNRQEIIAQMDLEVEISGFETWEDFDQIAEFIRTRYKTLLIQKVDGPDARICRLKLDDIEVLLIFDDMIGNFIRATNKESLDKIKRLVKEIETQLEPTK
jgi:hypothetical protein